jgi:hypothetical protein
LAAFRNRYAGAKFVPGPTGNAFTRSTRALARKMTRELKLKSLFVAAAIAVAVFSIFNLAALAQFGTLEEQGARRYCWQKMGIPLSGGGLSKAQFTALQACVTSRLGRPDPYMSRLEASTVPASSAQDDANRRQMQIQGDWEAAQKAQQARQASEQAARDADQRRIAAENAARLAEDQARKNNSTINRTFQLPGFLEEKVPINTITKLAAAVLLLLWLTHVKSKQSTPPVVRGLVGILVPGIQSLFFFWLGIKDEGTLGELSLLSVPFGLGEVALALIYKPHVA